ncbi:hypothetical protein D3C74_303840 [compost metagenome]
MEVLTHGLASRPFSTAFFASSAAASITDGFDVLVHDVIEAIATAPWNRSNCLPLVSVTGTVRRPLAWIAGESEAGKDSFSASSTMSTTSGA